jgi:hypothetical protein
MATLTTRGKEDWAQLMLRRDAQTLLKECEGNVKAAVVKLSNTRKISATQAGHLVRYWKDRDTPFQKSRPGRPPSIPLDVLLMCSEVVKAGPPPLMPPVLPGAAPLAVGELPPRRYYTNITSAVKTNAALNAVGIHFKVKPRDLARRIRRADKDLVIRTLDWKMRLPPHIKRERILNAKKMRNMKYSAEYFRKVLWLDGSHLWITTSNSVGSVVCSAQDANLPAVAPTTNFRNLKKLSWYLVVGWNGVVDMVPCSGCRPAEAGQALMLDVTGRAEPFRTVSSSSNQTP